MQGTKEFGGEGGAGVREVDSGRKRTQELTLPCQSLWGWVLGDVAACGRDAVR